MALCEKCGGHISENMKFCEKCGSPVSDELREEVLKDMQSQVQSEEVYEEKVDYTSDFEARVDMSEPVFNYESDYGSSSEYQDSPVTETVSGKNVKTQNFDMKKVAGDLASKLPPSFVKQGSKFGFFTGIGSLFVIALIYIVCFFAFMKDISYVVGIGATADMAIGGLGGDIGVSNLWMIVYFALNLLPALMCGYIFLTASSKSTKLVAIATPLLFFVMTVFSVVVWAICDADNFFMAVNIYGVSEKFGTLAWYTLMDCLSDAWYLKIPLSVVSILGFGIDFITNGRKK